MSADVDSEINRITRQRDELLRALKLAYKALPYSTHPDAFEATILARNTIANVGPKSARSKKSAKEPK